MGLLQQQQTKLAMTPELRQSISILQYSLPDLLQFLHEKAMENPLLEVEDPEHWQQTVERKNGQQESWIDDRYHGFPRSETETYTNPIDLYVHQDHSLNTYLIEQCGYLSLSQKKRKLLEFMIGNVDEDGYLTTIYEDSKELTGCTRSEWHEALCTLQQFDPLGVGARSIEECLQLQVRQSEWRESKIESLIEHHLHDLARHRIVKIAKALNVTSQDVQQMAEFIRTLNPRPGALFHKDETKYVVPDVIVEPLQGREFMIQVNDRVLPQIQMNPVYRHLEYDQDAKAYLEEMKQQYEWIVSSVKQRHRTILNVAQIIVDAQRDFFLSGQTADLKPLTLKQVSERLDVHESTVSRATNQKYVQTVWGVYELKTFFSTRLQQDHGGALSTNAVKEKVRELIDQEDKTRPLSDQAIVKALREVGIKVARRTVAKYREEAGILSSAQRKKYGNRR